MDDAGTDDTGTFLNDNYPQVTLMVNPLNLGFGETMNRGIFAARNDIILALNNDIQVEVALFAKCLPWFDNPDVFSVTPNMVDAQMEIVRPLPGLSQGGAGFIR